MQWFQSQKHFVYSAQVDIIYTIPLLFSLNYYIFFLTILEIGENILNHSFSFIILKGLRYACPFTWTIQLGFTGDLANAKSP